MSPADSTMWSPSTSWWMGSSRGVAALSSPSALLRRSTVAVLLTSDLRRSAARLERPSCTNRSSVESTTIARITTVASWSYR